MSSRSRAVSLEPGIQPSVWANSYCGHCAAGGICTYKASSQACGHPDEYKHGHHPADGGLTPADFHLRPIQAGPIDLPIALPVTTEPYAGILSGIRLRNSLGRVAWRGPGRRIAFLTGSDELHKRVLNRSGRLGAGLAAQGVEVAVTPDFSTYVDTTPYDTQLAISRSVECARLLSRHLRVVLSLVWRGPEDMRRWAEYLNRHPLPAIAADLGTLDRDMPWARECLQELLSGLRKASLTRLVIGGVCQLERIVELSQLWPGPVTFATPRPEALAIGGRLLLPDLTSRISDMPKPQLIRSNLTTFIATVSRSVKDTAPRTAVDLPSQLLQVRRFRTPADQRSTGDSLPSSTAAP